MLVSESQVGQHSECESTESQREIWMAAQMSDDANRAFNESVSLDFEGHLDRQALTTAVDDLMARHDALRARLSSDGRQWHFEPPSPAPLVHYEFNSEPPIEAESHYRALRQQAASTPFDLTGPLIRFRLATLSDTEHALILTCHRIIGDESVLRQLAAEVGLLYRSPVDQAELSAPASFCDYLNKNKSAITENREHIDYWTARLSTSTPFQEFPLDASRPPVRTHCADTLSHPMSTDAIARAEKMAEQWGASSMAVFTAGFAGFAHRLTGSQEILIGVPDSENNGSPAVGHSSGILPLRISVQGDCGFRDLVEQTEKELRQAREHGPISLSTLLNSLDIERDQSRPPLVSTFFSVELKDQGNWEHGELTSRPTPIPKQFSPFEMAWTIRANPARCECTFNTTLWQRDTVAFRVQEWITFVEAGLQDEECPVSRLPVLPEAERQILRETCVGPIVPDVAHHLTGLLDLQRFGERPAVSCAGQSISFAELDRRANQLANHLLSIGVQHNDLVGVFVERSVNMLVSLLATWKAGAGYVALDPGYPADRLLYMAETAQLKALITQTDLKTSLRYACPKVYLDRDQADIAARDDTAPQVKGHPEDTAYVIFTSGSTGKPKGVQITHGGVSNFLITMADRPGLTADARFLAVTTLSFDIAVMEVCLPLLVGGQVVIAEREQALDGYRLLSLIEDHSINVMQATPTTWRWMLAAGWRGQDDFKALCGGEPFPLDLARQLVDCVGEVWNMYGPTEATVWSTCHLLQRSDLTNSSISIGTPVANTQCYVLDNNGQLLPAGVPGELFIGGDGVANGYLGQPEKTAERFVPNHIDGEGRLYRTGDQARWLSDGTFECLGRLDSQIKLRGYRIELGEIEAALANHSQVLECAASVITFNEFDQRLVAYARLAEGAELTSTEMRRYLRDFLPDFMVPQMFVKMEAFPLTPNGKIDRNSLPNPTPMPTEPKARQQPRTETEKVLTEIWSELLQKEHNSIDELFFDVGGHSLLAMEMVATIEERLTVRLHVLDILVNTVEQLAAKIDNARNAAGDQSAAAMNSRTPGTRKPKFMKWLLGQKA